MVDMGHSAHSQPRTARRGDCYADVSECALPPSLSLRRTREDADASFLPPIGSSRPSRAVFPPPSPRPSRPPSIEPSPPRPPTSPRAHCARPARAASTSARAQRDIQQRPGWGLQLPATLGPSTSFPHSPVSTPRTICLRSNRLFLPKSPISLAHQSSPEWTPSSRSFRPPLSLAPPPRRPRSLSRVASSHPSPSTRHRARPSRAAQASEEVQGASLRPVLTSSSPQHTTTHASAAYLTPSLAASRAPRIHRRPLPARPNTLKCTCSILSSLSLRLEYRVPAHCPCAPTAPSSVRPLLLGLAPRGSSSRPCCILEAGRARRTVPALCANFYTLSPSRPIRNSGAGGVFLGGGFTAVSVRDPDSISHARLALVTPETKPSKIQSRQVLRRSLRDTRAAYGPWVRPI